MDMDFPEWMTKECSDANCILRKDGGGMRTHGGCQHLKTQGPETNRLIRALASRLLVVERERDETRARVAELELEQDDKSSRKCKL